MANVFDFAPIDIHRNNKNRKKAVIMTCKDGRYAVSQVCERLRGLWAFQNQTLLLVLKGG